MNIKNIIIGVLVITTLLFAGLYILKPVSFGGVSPDHYGWETFYGETRINMPRQTGTILTIASSSVNTLTAAQVCDNSVIAKNSWDGIASSTAITNLPTAAALFADCLPTNGDTFSIIFRNLHTVAGSSTAITAGASTTLVGVDANSDIINGANEALLEFVRYSATELIVIIREYTAAD
mgnify:FL=1